MDTGPTSPQISTTLFHQTFPSTPESTTQTTKKSSEEVCKATCTQLQFPVPIMEMIHQPRMKSDAKASPVLRSSPEQAGMPYVQQENKKVESSTILNVLRLSPGQKSKKERTARMVSREAQRQISDASGCFSRTSKVCAMRSLGRRSP